MRNLYYFLLLALVIKPCFAHGFTGSGWLHPLTGYDHMVAMIAVGAWSAQLGGKAIWRVPTAFVTAMFLGGLLGFEHFPISATEFGIAISVLILGLAIMIECKIGMILAAFGVAIFGICHGYAHGYEIPQNENKVIYVCGFLTTTICLHIVGAVGGLLILGEKNGRLYLRICGAIAMLIGIYLIFRVLH